MNTGKVGMKVQVGIKVVLSMNLIFFGCRAM